MKNIDSMISYVESYLAGNISRLDFELDFNYELTKHYRKMVREDRDYAELFYDYLSEDGVDIGSELSDSEFKKLIRKQLNEVKNIAAEGFC